MPHPTLTTSVDVIKEVFETNVFGVVSLTQAFIDLLRQSAEPRIVNLTTGLTLLTLHGDSSWRYYGITGAAYHPSKAAFNAYTVMLAQQLRDTPFKVDA
jgi:NAD(P)-dependent dehydrogenase (short-subunit alcohol dehydrogenase family)